MRGSAWKAGVLLLLLTQTVGANGFKTSFETTGAAQLDGEIDIEVSLAALVLTPVDAAGFQALVDSSVTAARLVNVPTEITEIRAPVGQPFQIVTALPEEDLGPVHVSNPLSITLVPGVQGEIRLLPTGEPAQAIAESIQALDVLPASAILEKSQNSTAGVLQEVHGHSTVVSAPYGIGAFSSSNRTNVSKPHVLLIAGPQVTLPSGEVIQTGRQLNASRSAIEPTTGSGRRVYDNRILVVEAAATSLECADCTQQMAWKQLQGSISGSAVWRGIDGTTTLDGQPLDSNPELMEVFGEFGFLAESREDIHSWSVAGEASAVSIDLLPILRTAIGSGVAIGLVLGLAALFFEKARGIVTFLLGRITPRLVKASPFGDATRRKILQSIHELQPATLRTLQQAAGVGRGTMRYHIRILLAHDVVQSTLPAGHVRNQRTFMLNSDSLMFTAAGATTETPQKAGTMISTASSSPIRSSILGILLADGPQSYASLQQRLQSAGVSNFSPPLASYHLSKLERAGLVHSTWHQGRKEYRAGLDPTAARKMQYSRLMQDPRSCSIVDSLFAANQLTMEDILSKHVGDRPREIRKRVNRLLDLAILHQDPDSKLYALAPYVTAVWRLKVTA